MHPRARVNSVRPLTQASAVAVLYVSAWLVFFAARAPGAARADAASGYRGKRCNRWAIGRWWAIMLPIAVVPILATPLPYTPGADPEYGVGMFFGVGFAVVAMVLLAAGVLGAKLTGH